ncbi:hypothetical protein BAUCODRAFT_123059 [Baudoinia panamericana UAMH 10762]|uniref:Zn(2)-C6 fungal-type domain-containing protein n=1 Tax=Baudoinia panamericana (strain UAMH 10762) TaxID=717646 RepID=M2MW28_BAUPA|nr:uncharacterized protein BAUCODRAFT_123059 [Baudoinia panamericana UAMH 10762]EMC95763.1 hypothetical protein BAUCODRAFT_123059 [Baudoinia panamericana UAMH 10762]
MDQRRPPYAAPPPPPSIVDSRANSTQPPPSYPAHPYPQPPPPAQHPQYSYPPPALPPINYNQAYGHPPPGTQPHLPPINQGQPPPHESRDAQEQYSYNQQPPSGHATPAPVNRTYSHDSAHQQRTPTTPAQAGPYPSGTVDGAQPPPQHMDHGPPHHGYPPTNGIAHHHAGPPPPMAVHHEHQPQYLPPPMENHHQQYQGPPQPSPMYPPPHASTFGPMTASLTQGQRKKQMRATQACEQCRQRKQKCDEGIPCSFCKENTLTCQYRDTPPAKTDKNMEQLLGYMKSHSNILEALTTKMDVMDARVRKVERATAHPTQGGDVQLPSHDHEQEASTGLKEDHRTAPHKLLLLWPSVGNLFKDAGIEHLESYVMAAEDRGILRIFTRGEGIDENDGTQPGAPSSPARSDSSGEGMIPSAPTPPEGIWGTGFPPTPSSSDIKRSELHSWGGLKPDNSLDLDASTITDLYASYMQHIHIMHPFLDRQRLRTLVEVFIKRYSTTRTTTAKFVSHHINSDSDRPLKRQRSAGSANDGYTRNQSGERAIPEHSPGNAIVYLVLALGKICQHRDPLPAVVAENRLVANAKVSHQLTGVQGLNTSSPTFSGFKQSPRSPNSAPPTTHPTPPVDGQYSRSRRSSISADIVPFAGARNLDIIPGLAYYAKAAEILGAQADGNDLVHAQMFLLAGLYKGQLARVKESMGWYAMAGRALRSLLDRHQLYNEHYWDAFGDAKAELERGKKLIRDKRHNLIVLASWTCLQLESDILAEMRLPSSGIKDIEDMLLMPLEVPEEESYSCLEPAVRDDDYSKILLFYTSQMFLRRRLNQVHRDMYGPACLNQSLEQVRGMLKGHESILRAWRQGLPPALRWEDSDPPAADILSARLRAKYWGAAYIVNRPFLDYALHIMSHSKDPVTNASVRDVAKDIHGNPRDEADIHLFQAIEGMGEDEVWQASMRCVSAAMQSTIALDGVPDRLIVTNIHGTAHAQFGNMLVLSATWHSRVLRRLVETRGQEFPELLERTIGFLRKLRGISPTCTHDCQILERIRTHLFGVPSEERPIYKNEVEPMSATHSFSAST